MNRAARGFSVWSHHGVAMGLLLAMLCFCHFGTTHAKTLPPFNILHVTDIHGWIYGHPHAPELNADFGDFVSLLEWMQQNAAAKGEEFFLFDSGDLIEGTGLSDATPIHGQYIFEAVKQVGGYTSLTMGNHDIGHVNVIDYMRQSFIPFWNGKYLTSNSLMKASQSFIGSPWYSFTTPLGTKVLVLGYLYNFTQEANNTVVVPVSVSLTQSYFKQAMAEPDVDFIVVVAHIDPTTPPELEQIYQAIRAFHPDTPLALFSGHRHIKYFQQYDSRAFTIESGKYFEVLGHVQFNIDPDSREFTNFSYEFVNTSKTNFYELAGKDHSNFLTSRGSALRQFIANTYVKLGLNKTLGCSPLTYNPDASIKDNKSLYRLYIADIVPSVIFNNTFSANSFFVMNDGTLRYDLYQGRVAMNDIYTVIPFGDVFYYVNVEGDKLKTVLKYINSSPFKKTWTSSRVPYYSDEARALKHALRGDQGNDFYYSFTPIDPDVTYTLVMAKYDTVALLLALNHLFPNDSWSSAIYPTAYSSTTALIDYIQMDFPCTASCNC